MKINTKKMQGLWKRSLFGDFDGDGVMNAFDCQPKNKKKQDAYTKDVDDENRRARKAAKFEGDTALLKEMKKENQEEFFAENDNTYY